jgi:hypothetical protein
MAAPFGIGMLLSFSGSRPRADLQSFAFEAGERSKEMMLTMDGEWSGTLASKMPKSLGESNDDFRLVVRAARRTRTP